DEQWIVNRGNKIDLWQGYEKQLWDGIKIINIGGHFPGSCILHVSSLSENVNVFCGDTFNISPSLKHISVMYSYPNRIPLSIKEIKRIKILVEKINFDTLYGFYSYQNLEKKAKNILMKSLDLYLK
ncbi:MAG: MBL fold metallo-hydrolase, partial [Ignavibacteriae bacterium]|nr:MBL fold metallo-hydrolase [Ignavibacteriota bacterium]